MQKYNEFLSYTQSKSPGAPQQERYCGFRLLQSLLQPRGSSAAAFETVCFGKWIAPQILSMRRRKTEKLSIKVNQNRRCHVSLVVHLQSTTPVAIATSWGLDIVCVTMIGTVKQNPSPIPARAWYPIHTPAPESVSKVINSPDAIVLRTPPRIKKGLKMPLAPMVMPTAIWVKASESISQLITVVNKEGVMERGVHLCPKLKEACELQMPLHLSLWLPGSRLGSNIEEYKNYQQCYNEFVR